MLAWLTHILPGELWKPVYGLCGLRCVRRLRGQVRIPCHSTRSHKRDVNPCVRWSLLRESSVMVLRDGFEPTTCCFNRLLLYQLSYRNIEAARETKGRKMPVKPLEEAFWGLDSFRRLRGKRRSAMRGSAYRKHTIYAFKEPYMWHIHIILARCNVRTLQICPKCVPEILHLL